MKTYTGQITTLAPNQIFVFGSNTQGRHGKGAALFAMSHGAVYGNPVGRQGQTYAIVTKNLVLRSHPSISPTLIIDQIIDLYIYAIVHTDLQFLVAYSGTGNNLNGYTPLEMAHMFSDAAIIKHIDIPQNIVFEQNFALLIKSINP